MTSVIPANALASSSAAKYMNARSQGFARLKRPGVDRVGVGNRVDQACSQLDVFGGRVGAVVVEDCLRVSRDADDARVGGLPFVGRPYERAESLGERAFGIGARAARVGDEHDHGVTLRSVVAFGEEQVVGYRQTRVGIGVSFLRELRCDVAHQG